MKEAFHRLLTQLTQGRSNSNGVDDGHKQVKGVRHTSWRQTNDDYLSIRAKKQQTKVSPRCMFGPVSIVGTNGHSVRNPEILWVQKVPKVRMDTKEFFTEYGEANRYTIKEVIGKGSYGVVCSALDTKTGQKVAIKKINNVFDHVSDATRILREIKLLRLLRHPGVHLN